MLSVIMAVYNGERYLKEAISSILNQSYIDFELVVVNDGSTDRTKEMIDLFSKDKRLKVIHLKGNHGAAHALNMAVEHSSGSWITVHDADDVSYLTRLEEQIHFIKVHGGTISAAGTLIECINGEPPIGDEKLPTISHNYNIYQTADEIMNIRFYVNPICHGTVIFSKDLFQQVGGYNTHYKIAYDYDLWMRFMNVKPIVKIPKILYKWRVFEKSLHRKDESETCNEVLHISSEHIKRLLYKRNQSARVIVFGTQTGCENYSNVVHSIQGLSVEKYIKSPSLLEIRNACRKIYLHEVDGVIILESDRHQKTLNYLTKAGLVNNQNLFLLWNVF